MKPKLQCPLCGMPLSKREIRDNDDQAVTDITQEKMTPPYIMIYHAHKVKCDYVEVLKCT